MNDNSENEQIKFFTKRLNKMNKMGRWWTNWKNEHVHLYQEHVHLYQETRVLKRTILGLILFIPIKRFYSV